MAKGMTSNRQHRGEAGRIRGIAASNPNLLGANVVDPESAARRYLDAALAAPAGLAGIAAPTAAPGAAAMEYKSVGIDRIPFTDTQYVKFRQYCHKIPVYGSLVSVELDNRNDFVSINTTVGDPSNVDYVAKLSPEAALKSVAKYAGYGNRPIDHPARLHFYFDDAPPARWRLAYVVEDVLRAEPRMPSSGKSLSALPQVSDFVVDAQNGDLIAELPRTQTMAAQDDQETAVDGMGNKRQIAIVIDNNNKLLHDRGRNIRTHNFDYRDAAFFSANLPGGIVINPPGPWHADAVSAHANAGVVIDFLRNVLQRDGLDGAGGEVVSSINCLFQSNNGSREWRNAAMFRGQMIYGQRLVDGQLRSYAIALDVVAHELLHGLTDKTARLEYHSETGALNESLSDIFGIMIANRDEPDVDKWNWEVGETLDQTGMPLRDLRDPARCGQPAHMSQFVVRPVWDDDGGVHINSGIHNKAAFNVLTASSANGAAPANTATPANGTTLAGAKLFAPAEVARLYYVALIAHLSRTSGFSDCRAALLLAAQTMFAQDPDRQLKINAIAKAYDDVGIP